MIGISQGRRPSDARGSIVAAVLVAVLATPASSVATRAVAASPPDAPMATEVQPWETRPTTVTRARDVLAHLVVEPRRADPAIDRDAWGDWTISDTGCDTREVVLAKQGLPNTVVRGKGCAPTCPEAVCWTSPYDGQRISNADDVDIDHIVSLKEAAASGASTWDVPHRVMFYNDFGNLVTVSAPITGAKGDNDPAAWRPPNTDAWCGYAESYIAVKDHYHLAIDVDERTALGAMLDTCP